MAQALTNLGSAIRERRRQLGLTQEQLGRGAGYKSGAGVTISRIESGDTRPSPPRLVNIARELGTTPAELTAQSQRTINSIRPPQQQDPARPAVTEEKLEERVQRIQRQAQARGQRVGELADAFNEAHDRAEAQFFVPFVQLAADVQGAPAPPQLELELELTDTDEDASAAADLRLQLAAHGIAQVLATSATAAAVGAGVGGMAAYGAFASAMTFGTASTGAAVAGLSGVAATNAALAVLGGGTLAAGGAGMAGGTAVLGALAVGPAVLLAGFGLLFAVRRSKRQRAELLTQLDEADRQLEETRGGYEQFCRLVPRATKTLDYIAVHATHALRRWESRLPTRPTSWSDLQEPERRQYMDFVAIAASQFSIVMLHLDDLMVAQGEQHQLHVALIDELLTQAAARVRELV